LAAQKKLTNKIIYNLQRQYLDKTKQIPFSDAEYLLLAYLITYKLCLAHSGRQEAAEEHGWIDGVAILGAVVLIVMVSAVNDWKKERQFRSLQSKIDSDHTYTVLRGGDQVQMPVSELVVGDICLVKYGTVVLGCIECMRFRLLLPMFAVSVCLSRGSTRLYCAKTAKQNNILFGVNTLGA